MELLKKIHAKVKRNGYITFDEYMDMCLYYPNLGYYNNKDISLDPRNSDFITGPEISSIFTDSIRDFYTSCKNNIKIDYIVEFGAGSGELAYNFLKDLDGTNLPKKYFIIEKSEQLKKQQKEKIRKLPENLAKNVEWISEINNLKNAFLIANEVLDAIPSKIFIKEKNNFYEKIIKIKNNKLYYSKMECEPFLKEKINNIEKRLNKKLPNDYSFEINLQYVNFFEKIFENIESFIFLLIDYGYSEKEYYLPERSSGTIQFYKNHKKIFESLIDQGTFDISVSVDFSRILRIINLYKIQLMSYTTQEQFLLNTNILENSLKISDVFARNNILKTLLFPTDMGESFKIMILCDRMKNDFVMKFKDYRHKL